MLRDPEGLATALKAKSHLIAAAVLVLCLLYFLVLRLTAIETGHVLRLPERRHTRAIGFQADVPSAGWQRRVFGMLGICVFIRDNSDAGIAASQVQHVKKENTSVKFSTRKGLRCAAHWANNRVKYSR